MDKLVKPRDPYRASFEEFQSFLLAYLFVLFPRWQARENQADHRVYPVPMAQFRGKGIADKVLHWMLYQGHVEHVLITQAPGGAPRPLRPEPTLHLQERSGFVITDAGAEFATQLILSPYDTDEAFINAWDALQLGQLHPSYDPRERILAWGRNILKKFRQPSESQETVVRTAEQLGWPGWFDDPLPRRSIRNRKARLHNTINALNRNQTTPLIHFKADGTGTRFGWEFR